MHDPGPSNTAVVELWFTQLDRVDPETFERYEKWLNDIECLQVARFMSERRRREFTVGRGLARRALAAELGVAPERIEFTPGPHGKLTIAVPGDSAGLDFNLSHTADCVVCATCRGFAVGLDIERIVDRVDPLLIAGRFFHESEAALLTALRPTERLDRFFSLWTLKEALAKAHGLGVLAPIDSSRIDFTPDGAPRVSCDAGILAQAAWFGSGSPSTEHRLALCVLCADSIGVQVVPHACPPDPGSTLMAMTWSQARLQIPKLRT